MSAEVPNQPNNRKGSSFRTRRLLDHWPLMVWAAILGMVLFMYSKRGVQVRINGMIAVHTEEISASEDGIIMEILVKEGEKVAKGQELVKRICRESLKPLSSISTLTYKELKRKKQALNPD